MRKDRFSLILCSLLLFVSSFSFSQGDTKWYFGGNLGLMFGTYTLIDISPLVGYKVTERLHVGAGATYTYYKYSEDGTYNGSSTIPGYTFDTHIYGGRLFTRLYALPNLFLHVEDELISLEMPDPDRYPIDATIHRQWLNSILFGGGYGYAFGHSGPALSVMLLFRAADKYQQFYPYQNPIIRVGLGFGF